MHKEQKGFCRAQTQAAPFKLFHQSHFFRVSGAQEPLGVGRGYWWVFVLCGHASTLFESVNTLSENRCKTLVCPSSIWPSQVAWQTLLQWRTRGGERRMEWRKEREGDFKISPRSLNTSPPSLCMTKETKTNQRKQTRGKMHLSHSVSLSSSLSLSIYIYIYIMPIVTEKEQRKFKQWAWHGQKQ